MKAVILHSEVSRGAGRDEEDVLVQVEAVFQSLSELGCHSVPLPFSMDIRRTIDELMAVRPDFVFNLVETMGGSGRLIHIAPALLDHLGIHYTGARTEALFLTSNKLIAKGILKASQIPTPPWFAVENERNDFNPPAGPCIIKSVWEHASVGIAEDSVILPGDARDLIREMEARMEGLGGSCFAEAYVEGREFNLSLLARESGLEVLPPAEIRFDSFPAEKMRVVGYRAKWEPESFEYGNTPRIFDFSDQDEPLIQRLMEIAGNCWRVFGLRGYARVDFRVDAAGNAWVLEVNANPCLSPDAGFLAAAEQAGISATQAIERIIKDSVPAFLR